LQYNEYISLLPAQILLCFGTVLPDSTNFFAGVLVGAVATGFVAFGSYTFMHLAQMAAEVELRAIHATACTINALWRDLVGVIHLAPFFRHRDAHLVVVLNRGNASLAGLTVYATA